MRPLGISPQFAYRLQGALPILSRSSVARKRMRTRERRPQGPDSVWFFGDQRAGGQAMGHLVSSSLTKMAYPLSTLNLTQATSCRHRFLFFIPLSPPFLKKIIFKENSRMAEGAQLRRSLAAQRAQQGAAGLPDIFPGRQ